MTECLTLMIEIKTCYSTKILCKAYVHFRSQSYEGLIKIYMDRIKRIHNASYYDFHVVF